MTMKNRGMDRIEEKLDGDKNQEKVQGGKILLFIFFGSLSGKVLLAANIGSHFIKRKEKSKFIDSGGDDDEP